ncbi:MAG: hypothetical protein M0C28_35830 [Candidatus Moduliflexus flocculans]|nr:hypothetical protein [Candidatus Moduliflexus flocculans]
MQTELGRIAGLIQGIKKETTPLQRKLEEFSKILVYLCFFLVAIVFGLEILRGGKVLGHVPDLGQPGRRRHPRGPPGGRDHRPGPGRPAHGPAPRPHPQAALGRDPRLRHGHLLGQDRHPDQERDDGPGRLDLARRLRGDRHGLRARRRVPDGARAGSTRPPTPTSSRRCRWASSATTPSSRSRTGRPRSSATRPRSPSSAPRPRPASGKASEEDAYEMVEEIPFDSERKKMSIVRRADQDLIAFTKGAPDLLLRRLHLHPGGRRERPLTDARPRADHDGQRRLFGPGPARPGRRLPDLEQEPHSYAAEAIERDLTFAGLVAMIDPPRPEVRDGHGQVPDVGHPDGA